MTEEPHKILLDRNLYSVIIREYFADTLSLLEELVNYGSNLIPRCYQSSEKKLHDIVILLNFLKQAVSLLDSIHILAEKGCTTPCYISLRSLFEIGVYLDWIFKAETEKRGSLYFVWDLRRRLYWALSLKKGTREYNAFQKHMQDAPSGLELEGVGDALIDDTIERLRKKLLTPECSIINDEFDLLKKGLRDREWYVPGGVNNLREMAVDVGKEGMYIVFYSPFSNVTHGLALSKQVRFQKKEVIFEPIRNLTQLDEIFGHAFNFSIGLYRKVLTYYRPGEIQNFNRKYNDEWKERFFSVKKIEYKNGTYTITDNKLAKKKVELTSSNFRR